VFILIAHTISTFELVYLIQMLFFAMQGYLFQGAIALMQIVELEFVCAQAICSMLLSVLNSATMVYQDCLDHLFNSAFNF